ncbi:HAD family hydrolase [Streptomyces sp. L7]
MKIHAEALLFDNDGTLVSSLESVRRCWTRWAAESRDHRRGLRPGRTARADRRGDSRRPAARRRRPGGGRADRGAGGRGRAQRGCPSLPGTRDFLDSLPADRWAVVTSATRRLAEARLAHAGILPKTLVVAEDVTRGKPDPELLPPRRPPTGRRPGPLCRLRGRPRRDSRRAARPE